MLGREREKKRKETSGIHSLKWSNYNFSFLPFLFVPRKHYYSASKLLAVNYLAKLSTQKDILANNTVVA